MHDCMLTRVMAARAACAAGCGAHLGVHVEHGHAETVRRVSGPPRHAALASRRLGWVTLTGGGGARSHKADLRQLIPLPDYDIFVLGVQECITDELFEEVEKLLRRTHYRLLVEGARAPRCRCCPLSLGADEPTAVRADRVWGRGDGSFLRPKFTGSHSAAAGGPAAHSRYSAHGQVWRCLCGMSCASTCDLSALPRARWASRRAPKGCVFCCPRGLSPSLSPRAQAAALALEVFDTTIAFVSAHLSAKSAKDRAAGYSSVLELVGG
jgi:hypothetical protein